MKVFISYRRDDLGGHASLFVGRLRDQLAAKWGGQNIFMDVDSIPYGADFGEYLAARVAQADVLLAVMGPQWGEEMVSRAGSDEDFVRIEIESALNQGIHVIPVLAGDATMPGAEGLPESMLALRRRNALTVDSGRDFHHHMGRLVEALEMLPPPQVETPSPSPVDSISAPSAPTPQPTAGDTMTDSHGIEFVWCPPGTFIMGSQESEEGRLGRETQHQVRLSEGFWIAKYLVTQGQWESLMGSNLSWFRESGPDAAVENVSWDDVVRFCLVLAVQEGVTYSLPTEAQWEYACRAGSTTAFCFGDDPAQLEEYAWFERNSDGKTHPVGQKLPNAWGLHDCHGLIWEWCADWYGDCSSGPVTDPTGPEQAADRVIRGGSWLDDARFCRSASRNWLTPDISFNYLGFRPVRSVVQSGK